MQLDPDMPVRWVVDLVKDVDIAVYPVLQPYIKDKTLDRDLHGEHELDAMIYAEKEHFRAAANNLKMHGADGFYSWFLKWPLGDEQKTILNELKFVEKLTTWADDNRKTFYDGGVDEIISTRRHDNIVQ